MGDDDGDPNYDAPRIARNVVDFTPGYNNRDVGITLPIGPLNIPVATVHIVLTVLVVTIAASSIIYWFFYLQFAQPLANFLEILLMSLGLISSEAPKDDENDDASEGKRSCCCACGGPQKNKKPSRRRRIRCPSCWVCPRWMPSASAWLVLLAGASVLCLKFIINWQGEPQNMTRIRANISNILGTLSSSLDEFRAVSLDLEASSANLVSHSALASAKCKNTTSELFPTAETSAELLLSAATELANNIRDLKTTQLSTFDGLITKYGQPYRTRIRTCLFSIVIGSGLFETMTVVVLNRRGKCAEVAGRIFGSIAVPLAALSVVTLHVLGAATFNSLQVVSTFCMAPTRNAIDFTPPALQSVTSYFLTCQGSLPLTGALVSASNGLVSLLNATVATREVICDPVTSQYLPYDLAPACCEEALPQLESGLRDSNSRVGLVVAASGCAEITEAWRTLLDPSLEEGSGGICGEGLEGLMNLWLALHLAALFIGVYTVCNVFTLRALIRAHHERGELEEAARSIQHATHEVFHYLASLELDEEESQASSSSRGADNAVQTEEELAACGFLGDSSEEETDGGVPQPTKYLEMVNLRGKEHTVANARRSHPPGVDNSQVKSAQAPVVGKGERKAGVHKTKFRGPPAQIPKGALTEEGAGVSL